MLFETSLLAITEKIWLSYKAVFPARSICIFVLKHICVVINLFGTHLYTRSKQHPPRLLD